MANTKINDLTAKATAVGTDEIIINDAAGGNLDKKEALSVVKTFCSLSPTLVTPALGTPASGDLSSCNGYKETFAIALGDESTVLAAASTTVPVVTYHIPYGFTLTDVKAGLTVAGTGAALVTVDIHEAGTTILSTKITIDASEKTSATAATPPVISDSSLAADSLIEIFVDLVDTNNLAAGLKVYLIGYQT